jgi:hypothetical protein
MTNRAEIKISLELKPLPIPYHAVKRDDGENFGYKSLIKSPELIEDIPELADEPAIKRFISHINSPNRNFETVRMLHWINHDNGRAEQIICFGFIFRNRELFSNFAYYMQFAGALLQLEVDGVIQLDRPCLLELQPAHLLHENLSGWIADIYVAGGGASEDEARQRLGQILDTMQSIF